MHAAEPCEQCRRLRLPDGRAANYWRHDGVLIRHAKASHVLRVPPAIAFDEALIAEQRQGLESIIVVLNDQVLSIDITDFDKNAFHVNRGFGEQVAVTLQNWQEW